MCLIVKTAVFNLFSNPGSTVRSGKCSLISSLNFPYFKMVMMIVPSSWYCEDNKLTQKHLAQCCVQFVLFLFPNPQETKISGERKYEETRSKSTPRLLCSGRTTEVYTI